MHLNNINSKDIFARQDITERYRTHGLEAWIEFNHHLQGRSYASESGIIRVTERHVKTQYIFPRKKEGKEKSLYDGHNLR